MRISNRQMFSAFTSQMNSSLSNVMESNLQGGSGNRINRPSDDPASMGRILMFRASIDNIGRYKQNINEAAGWLNLADSTLGQVSTLISTVKQLDLQGATGTVTGENRQQISNSLRQHFQQFLNMANMTYNGQHLFAGHKSDATAFDEALGITTRSESLNEGMFIVSGGTSSAAGGSQYSTVIRFVPEGDYDLTAGDSPGVRYSRDGGQTWFDGTLNNTFAIDGTVTIKAGDGCEVVMKPKDPLVPGTWGKVSGASADDDIATKDNGSWLIVRPAVTYNGDDHDTQATLMYGSPVGTINAGADGYFNRDITVRIDKLPAVPGDPIEYSYSLDNGSNWISGTAPDGATQLAVPGGFLTIGASEAFEAGLQFMIHPYRADINFEIGTNQIITVNMVGKDVFGGLYEAPFSKDGAQPVAGPNLFETMGRLIGYAETNDQAGIGQCLEELDEILRHITTKNTEIGGRENRLESAFETLITREMSETDGMKGIEAVDTIELMTKLAQQQLAYNTVLKSSSMIMQMSLMNFI